MNPDNRVPERGEYEPAPRRLGAGARRAAERREREAEHRQALYRDLDTKSA